MCLQISENSTSGRLIKKKDVYLRHLPILGDAVGSVRVLKHVLAEIAFAHSTLNTSMSPSNPIGGTALAPVQNSKKELRPKRKKQQNKTCIKLASIPGRVFAFITVRRTTGSPNRYKSENSAWDRG